MTLPLICTVAAELLQIAPGHLGAPVKTIKHQYTLQFAGDPNSAPNILAQPLTIVSDSPDQFSVGAHYSISVVSWPGEIDSSPN